MTSAPGYGSHSSAVLGWQRGRATLHTLSTAPKGVGWHRLEGAQGHDDQVGFIPGMLFIPGI